MIGTVNALADAAPLVLWAPTNFPRRTAGGSVVTASVVRGPLFHATSIMQSDEPTVLTWTVDEPTANQRVGLTIAGARWTVDVGAVDTATTARDALLDLFTAEILPGVTIAASGADAITFDANDVPGLLWRPQSIGALATVTVDESIVCEVSTATAEVVVELQAYAAGRGMSALSILADVAGGLNMDVAAALRLQNGVSLTSKSELVDLTAIAGADWESRASFRTTWGIRSYKARAIDAIESVELTSSLGDDSVVILVEA